MLGRLQMSVEDAIKTYISFTKDVFTKKKLGATDSIFKAAQFEKTMKSIVKSVTGNAESLMMDQGSLPCRRYANSSLIAIA